jgi:predicted  nucleic acid-binding Zn-ribbon protein
MKNKETQIQWLQNELKKDQEDLKKEKLKFIEKIKGIDKEISIPKPKKLTLWQRIKQVLIQS